MKSTAEMATDLLCAMIDKDMIKGLTIGMMFDESTKVHLKTVLESYTTIYKHIEETIK